MPTRPPAPTGDDIRFRDRACPRDHTPLDVVKLSVPGPDVKIDRCPRCEGVFLDKNELVRITGDTKLNSYLRDRAALDSDSKLVCPHCGGIMDLENVAGIGVEVCLTCFGLWLDKDELDALKARPNLQAVSVPDDKDEEVRRGGKAVAKARQAKTDARLRGRSTSARAIERAKMAAEAPFTALDRGLDGFIRRYL